MSNTTTTTTRPEQPLTHVRRLVGELVISTVRLLDQLETMQVQPPAEFVEQVERLNAAIGTKAIEATPVPVPSKPAGVRLLQQSIVCAVRYYGKRATVKKLQASSTHGRSFYDHRRKTNQDCRGVWVDASS